MAANTVKLSSIINDFLVTADGDDHGSNVTDTALRNIALRGIREIGFDLSKKTKSVKLPIEKTNDTVALPSDFVDFSKIGVVDTHGFVRVMVRNENINYSMKEEGANLVDSKTATSGMSGDDVDDFYQVVFENYVYQGSSGNLYGFGGAHRVGEYRLNLDQNRIEVSTNKDVTEVVLEYIADEAKATDPSVHVYTEEALRSYIYYKLIERKSNVPISEKQRARAEYYNERRLANARMTDFTKSEVLKTIRKNFMQAPKF